MDQLQKLNTEKLNLSAMALEIDEHISSAEHSLEASFISGDDSDKLAEKVAQLKTKRDSLSNAIQTADKAIKVEQQRLVDETYQKGIKARKGNVKAALVASDKAIQLQEQLAEQLQIITTQCNEARFNNTEIKNGIRAIVGRLAAQFKLHGGLQMAAVLPIPTSADTERLQSKVH